MKRASLTGRLTVELVNKMEEVRGMDVVTGVVVFIVIVGIVVCNVLCSSVEVSSVVGLVD